ncbi:EAL domain-containing protein [Paenibacillus sp. NEAU-GSW1]|uniref:EAL domain-containing protein n=1 Tax=Paenibacillus sp. NEAU-GSW1 TaxID=2682486 RepID=UPI0012E1106D|nr:EAL domain-containing protein [Paenibacillus sp. NEAU-GSW1]MUT67812.1 EAL domain-containing protein [Paenibacillus sp. NEAU-GSW1]
MRKLRLSIAQKLITALGALMLLSFTLLLWFHLVKLYDANLKQGELLAQKQSITYIGSFTKNVNDTLTQLESMRTAMLHMRLNDEPNRDSVVTMLEVMVVENPHLLGAFTIWEPDAFDQNDAGYHGVETYESETGRFAPYVVRMNGMIQSMPIVDYDLPTSDYYQIPKQTNRFTLLDPYTYIVNGEPMIMTSLVVPIIDDSGHFLGIVGADFSLPMLQREVEKVQPLDGYASIITSNNHYLVNGKHPELAMQPYEMWPGGVSLDEIKQKAEKPFYTKDLDGSGTVLRMFYPIQIEDYTWYFEVVIPKENMLTEYRRSLWNSIAISVAALAAIAVLMVLLLRKIVLQNIQKVAHVSEALAMGDLKQKLDIRSNDEFEHMANQFNRMIEYRKEAEELIEFQATHDLLTGIPNRYGFTRYWDGKVASAMRDGDYQSHTALLYIDLDRFKIINDTLDYSMGDLLLKQIAKRVAAVVSPSSPQAHSGYSGKVFRFGGDEFVVLLEDISHLHQARMAGDDILQAIAEPIKSKGRLFYITASIGMSVHHELEQGSGDRLVKEADIALYISKKQRNTCTLYTPSLNDVPKKEIVLENSLNAALEDNQFTLVYQPKIELSTGRVYGAEALIRWKHPELGMVSPLEFIPLAERTGFIIPLGEWVLRQACKQIKLWEQAGITALPISVNMSMIQFQQKHIVHTIESIISEAGIRPEQLELELTESIFMDNPEHTLKILHELQRLGVQLSLDDFGTGYSSLSYLQSIPLHYLKLDKSFIHEIVSDIKKQMIFKSLVVIAHNLNMKVVTEGVETMEELEIIRKHKCDLVQGYYYSPPVPPDAFVTVFESAASAAEQSE